MSGTADSGSGILTVVSGNRPLTREARKALQDAEVGIVEERSVNELGRWTEVDVEERPSEDLLDRHELYLDIDPDVVYETDHGERVEIYPERVISSGVEATISPGDAKAHAEEHGWDRIE